MIISVRKATLITTSVTGVLVSNIIFASCNKRFANSAEIIQCSIYVFITIGISTIEKVHIKNMVRIRIICINLKIKY